MNWKRLRSECHVICLFASWFHICKKRKKKKENWKLNDPNEMSSQMGRTNFEMCLDFLFDSCLHLFQRLDIFRMLLRP